MLQKQFRLPPTVRLLHPKTRKKSVFICKYADNGLPYNRYGFIIRKAVEPLASHRNRIRRLVRSCIEELHPELKAGYDMLFLLEKGIIEKTRETLLQEVSQLFHEEQLLS
jgi:ribonuclease P protein component